MKVASAIRGLLLLLIFVGSSWAIIHRGNFSGDALEAWVQAYGVAAPIVFMLIYAAGTVFFVPGAVLTVAGGALFGPFWGTFYNLTGATFGATLAFLVARYIASAWVTRRAGNRLQQLLEGTEREGWKFVALVRLAPLFPFNLSNYAFGLTRIRLLHYAVASYVFMLPGAIAYTYLGYVGREAAAGRAGLVQNGLIALALLAIAGLLPTLVKIVRTPTASRAAPSTIEPLALHEQMEAHSQMVVIDVRSAGEYSGPIGHIDGARNIPIDELPSRKSELDDAREQQIVIVCLSEKRSAMALRQLAEYGFRNLTLLRGGMNQWVSYGLPVVR